MSTKLVATPLLPAVCSTTEQAEWLAYMLECANESMVRDIESRCPNCPFAGELDAGFVCMEFDCSPAYAREVALIEKQMLHAHRSGCAQYEDMLDHC
jgi:hypothetical protein